MAVTLETYGARVASVGLSIEYDRTVLRLPRGSSDVHMGTALDGGQMFSPVVSDGAPGRISLMVAPPVRVPVAVIGDGEVAMICFTVQHDAPSGCSFVRFVPGSVDIGDNEGTNLAVGPAQDGGVLVRSDGIREKR